MELACQAVVLETIFSIQRFGQILDHSRYLFKLSYTSPRIESIVSLRLLILQVVITFYIRIVVVYKP